MITTEQREAEVSTLSLELIRAYRDAVDVHANAYARMDYCDENQSSFRDKAAADLKLNYDFLLARIAYLERKANGEG